MTRKGRRTSATPETGRARFKKAERDHSSAETLLALKIDEHEPADDVAKLIIQAAIAYTDAVTAEYGGEIAQGRHTESAKVLRDALGNRLPKEQETRLGRLITHKETVEYGARETTVKQVQQLQLDLDRYASWVREVLGGC